MTVLFHHLSDFDNKKSTFFCTATCCSTHSNQQTLCYFNESVHSVLGLSLQLSFFWKRKFQSVASCCTVFTGQSSHHSLFLVTFGRQIHTVYSQLWWKAYRCRKYGCTNRVLSMPFNELVFLKELLQRTRKS